MIDGRSAFPHGSDDGVAWMVGIISTYLVIGVAAFGQCEARAAPGLARPVLTPGPRLLRSVKRRGARIADGSFSGWPLSGSGRRLAAGSRARRSMRTLRWLAHKRCT